MKQSVNLRSPHVDTVLFNFHDCSDLFFHSSIFRNDGYIENQGHWSVRLRVCADMHFSSKGMFFSLLILAWYGMNGALAKPGEYTTLLHSNQVMILQPECTLPRYNLHNIYKVK